MTRKFFFLPSQPLLDLSHPHFRRQKKTRQKKSVQVLIFTVLAQVIGAPLGAAFIGPAEGFLGMRGWQVMFVVEGALTALLGLSIPFVVSDSVEESPWLSSEETAWVLAAQKREEDEEQEEEKDENEAEAKGEEGEEKKKRSPPPPPPPPPQKKQSVLSAAAESLQIVKSPQIWTLGIAILLVQTAFFAVTFFAPLLIAETFSKEAMALSAAANAKGGKVPAAVKAPYLGVRALGPRPRARGRALPGHGRPQVPVLRPAGGLGRGLRAGPRRRRGQLFEGGAAEPDSGLVRRRRRAGGADDVARPLRHGHSPVRRIRLLELVRRRRGLRRALSLGRDVAQDVDGDHGRLPGAGGVHPPRVWVYRR